MSGHSFPSPHGGASPTKLTLVLPPRTKPASQPKAGAAAGKAGKKAKGGKTKERVRGPPRPPKLKPLKEVLSRIITLAEKRDAYGFFLQPVNPVQVPGYSDVIKRPMDYGTIHGKVSRGKYRSLDEFADDMRLVTTNAKKFNPVGSIYHSEAERIETWAEDQIAKAAVSVIEYETDWRLDVEGDEQEEPLEDDEPPEPAPAPVYEPEPTSPMIDDDLLALHAAAIAGGRRPPQRAAVKKIELERAKEAEKEKEKEKSTEKPAENGLDEDGHMPGYKDGIGVFPPDSGWSQVMVELKFRGKRYKTKKERLRIEKEGLPRAPDGSLDYWEIEDPWSVLHTLAPDPDSLPTVQTVFPPPIHTDSAQTLLPAPAQTYPPPLPSPLPPTKPPEPAPTVPKRKFWSISRTGYGRPRGGKDREDTLEPTPGPGERGATARPLAPTDFGGYATLVGRLAADAHVTPAHASGALGTRERLFAFLRAGLDADAVPALAAPPPKGARGYWTDARARDAAEYVRDLVYGGPDGLAYARSVAEFVSGPAGAPCADALALPLGMPLPEWALRTTLAPLTHGRLALLTGVARRLLRPDDPGTAVPAHVQAQLDTSATLFPHLTLLLLAMRQILAQPIDLAHLLRAPAELLGVHVPLPAAGEKRKRPHGETDAGSDAKKPKREDGVDEGPAADAMATDADVKPEEQDQEEDEKPALQRAPDFANASEFSTALQASGDAIVALEQKRAKVGAKPAGEPVDADLLEALRLGLLRLARAVPVDQLAKLPPELVPPEIRHIVPTRE